MGDKKEGIFFFVVQKHQASNLHYDFRLEIGKVMPSWAIPKGPTLDQTVKRLAMQTTDHSLAYRHFEGILPEGAYGAGPVIIWDEGTYFPEVEINKSERKLVTDKKQGVNVMQDGLIKGALKFFLFGKRLTGSFALVKTKNFGPKNAWLLIKHADPFCQKGYDITAYNKSVVSEQTIEQIEKS